MDKAVVASSSHNRAQRLYDKNIELENRRRKAAQARVPSDPNAWQQMRENFETIILEDHTFSEKHSIEFALWQLHYKRIEEFRAHYNAASAANDSTPSKGGGGPTRALKIRSQFKTFLSEATGFYHDLILKIRAKYGLPIGQFYPEPENHKEKDGKIKNGLISCHRCYIYLGDLARYKGLYGEGESKSRDYAAASSYYLQAASLWPSSGNPHHQLAILATYSGDELMAVYRYFRSLAAENPFSTARDNLIVAFEKNRQTYTQLHLDLKASSVKESPVRSKVKGRGKADTVVRSKESVDGEKTADVRQMLKAFRVRFIRLNGVLFTRTSLETFEEILSLVTGSLQELVSSGPEDVMNFGTNAVENGLFVVIIVSIVIFMVNNVKGGTEGQSYADIVQNTLLLKNALVTFYELMGILLKRCLQLTDLSSSFLLPGILVCVEWIACHPDVVRNEIDEKRSTAQIEFWGCCISLFNKLLSAGLVTYDDDDDVTSCFSNMTAALFEDFELRGFLPLQHVQTFLDFSRMHTESKTDKVARVKRILRAGKLVVDKITIDHKKVKFDSKLKKFVIGVEPKKDKGGPELNGGIKETSGDTSAPVVVKQSNVELNVEVEEEDEVILFRPNLFDNKTEVVSKGTHQEDSEQMQNKDVASQSIGQSVNTNSQSIGHPVNTNSQSIGQPVNNYPQSIGQAVNNYHSKGQLVDDYPQTIGQSVNNYHGKGQLLSDYPHSTEQPANSYPQSIGQPVNDYSQSIGQAVNNFQSEGQLVNDYPQSTEQSGNSYPQSIRQPVNDYSQSIGQPVNSYPQSIGQPVDSYSQSIGQGVNNHHSKGQLVNDYLQSTEQTANNYPQSIGQPVNIYPQTIGQAINDYAQSIGNPVNDYSQSIGQPVNSYPQSVGQALNNHPQSMGQQGNNYTQSSIGQSYQFQSPMWSSNMQLPVSVSGGLQGLSLHENGHLGQTTMHRDFQISNVTGLRKDGMMYTGTSQSMVGPSHIDTVAPSGPDPYTVGRNVYSSMPTSSLKGPTNRPVRHLGPPPGFGSVRSKQINEHGSGSSQNPLNDDYSWLDGYQLQSYLKAGSSINLPSNTSTQYANGSVATSNFPFPGKQVQFEDEKPKILDSKSMQLQYVPRVDQQGQSMWKGNQFV